MLWCHPTHNGFEGIKNQLTGKEVGKFIWDTSCKWSTTSQCWQICSCYDIASLKLTYHLKIGRLPQKEAGSSSNHPWLQVLTVMLVSGKVTNLPLPDFSTPPPQFFSQPKMCNPFFGPVATPPWLVAFSLHRDGDGFSLPAESIQIGISTRMLCTPGLELSQGNSVVFCMYIICIYVYCIHIV